MKRTPLRRKTPLKRTGPIKRGKPQVDGKLRQYHTIKRGAFSQLKKRKRIPQKSSKRKVEEVEYRKLSKAFLLAHPACEGCLVDKRPNIKRATEIQHKALRGKFYLRTDTWAAVCREHGEKCTVDNPWAYATGLRLTREQIRALPDAQK